MKHPLFSRLSLLSLAFVPALLPSCRTPYYQDAGAFASADGTQPPAALPAAKPLYEWNGDGVEGATKVTIDLSEQKATITKGGKNVGWTMVATGLPTHPTPKGSFSISERKVDKESNKYGVIINAAGEIVDNDASPGREKVPSGCRYIPAKMPYWMRITNFGVGMHAGPIPDPGSTASHGCIRLPADFAATLFHNTKSGTPVVIKD